MAVERIEVTRVEEAREIVEALLGIEDRLRDLAFERLRIAAEEGDVRAVADERRVQQARRAVERAIRALDADHGAD